MKKVFILINHFQVQDGVARTAIGLANELAKQEGVEVTLQSLFLFDKSMLKRMDPKVRVKPFFGFYFRGFAKLVDLIPDSLLYRMIMKDKYDIEIGFCMELPIKIIAASCNLNCKHYGWIHGYDTGLSLKECYEKMDRVICVSECNAKRFALETDGKIPVDCCYNLVDDEKVCMMGQINIELPRKDGITFVAVGRLEPGKGILRLIECAARLKKEGYLFNVWLIGDGDQRQLLEKRTHELELCECVKFLGAQENPHAYTSKADVLVCASYSEGYSTACVEAIMLGVPILTTNVSGAQEIIDEAEAGILVGMEDNDLYEGMKKILEYPELIEQWKSVLKETQKRFSYRDRAKKMLDILLEDVSSGR